MDNRKHFPSENVEMLLTMLFSVGKKKIDFGLIRAITEREAHKSTLLSLSEAKLSLVTAGVSL